VLDNGILRVRVDEATGGIVELAAAGISSNLVDAADGKALNEYLYFTGDNPAGAQRNGRVSIRVGERGPLVASLLVESDAPGCFRLSREIRLQAGADYVEIVNGVDKKRLESASYKAKEGKESVNFSFPFRVPGGEVRLDVPFGVVRPDADQIPSACKNWFTVGRWADVANDEHGITWVTLDAPLLQVGGLTANLLNSQTDPDVWRKRVGPTQRLDCWAMNNHWGTNYRAYQEGPTEFRFVLRPHRGPTDAAAATRFAAGFSQPLLVAGARGDEPRPRGLLNVSSPDVVVTGLKPGDDGRGVIARLYNASPREQAIRVEWSGPPARSVRVTDTSERPGTRLPDPLRLAGHELMAVRIELK
jgi:alpha-mannosidase